MKEHTERLKIAAGDYAVPGPEEVSSLLREYAQPLLYVDPAGPADVETIRTAMMLAMICWNLPVYEATGSPLFEQGTRTLHAVMERVPHEIGVRLRGLLEDRKTKFGSLPFLAMVEVQGDRPESARIVAEARMPKVARRC